MRRQYLLSVAVASADLTRPRIRADWGAARAVHVGPYQVLIYTPNDWPASGLVLEQTGETMRLVEGELLPGGATSQPIRPGLFNEILIDGNAGTVTVRNDAYGALPCYFRAQRDTLLLSNSLGLITDFTGADVDEPGLAQQLLTGYPIGARTLFRDVWLMMPGRGYQFDLRARGRLSMWRQSRMWTGLIEAGSDEVVGRFRDLWEQALDRSPGRTREPVAVVFGEGTASRLVAAAINARGVPLVALSHAAADSPEAGVARRVAEAARAQLLTNPLDGSFEFGRLALGHLFHAVDTLYNPQWDSSAAMLLARGFRRFTTAGALDLFLGAGGGGQAAAGLRLGLAGRAAAHTATEADLNHLVEAIARPHEQRARVMAPLLVEPYRSFMLDYFAPVRRAIAERLISYAADGPVSRAQLHERFIFEHAFRRVALAQERALMHYGVLVAPALDPDLGLYLSNLSPAVRSDARLLGRIIRKLYPRMAHVPAAGAPQSRLLPAALQRMTRGREPEPTPGFETWLLLGDHLAQYERLFTTGGHFFNVAAVNAYFAGVRQGRMSVGDGNDTLALLQLAWQVRPHVSRAAAASRITATINGRLRTTGMVFAAD